MEDFADSVNSRNRARLRADGSLKWTGFGDAIGAWIAEMDFGLAAPIRAVLREYAESELFGYPPDRLAQQLGRATDAYYARNFDWSPGAQQVVPTADVLAGLGAVLDFYLPAGAPVVLPTPAYMPFLEFPATRNRQVIEVPMLLDEAGWHMDLAGIDRALARAGGLVILCNPHNPIGKVYSRAELLELERVVARHDARVFSDEIHAAIRYDGVDFIPYASISERAAAQAITATSASKAFNIPGLKCAQLLFSHPADRAVWEERGFFVSHGASTPGLLATVAAYDHAAQWSRDAVDYLHGSRELLAGLLADQLPAVSWRPPQGTYLAWLDATGLGLGPTAQQFMLERAGVAMVDGAACGTGYDDFLRLNFAMPQPVLVETVKRMAAAVDAARGA